MIAHVDADSFFASVLQRQDPRLKGKPLLALGMGGSCVIAASYEAKAKGVKTGMPLKEARKLCPGAIERASDFRETGLASKQIEMILESHCPVIQQMSIDEWYLDLRSCVGGLPEDLEAWVRAVQKEILKKTDIGVSIGVGPSKLLAKMAGEFRKPAGITILRSPSLSLPKGEGRDEGSVTTIERMLKLRPAAAIPGIGRQRTKVTDERGWKTAWDIAEADTEELRACFGKQGPELQAELRGEALSIVTTEEAAPKSIQRARSFRAAGDKTEIWAHVLQHLQYVTLKMRRQDLATGGIGVWLRDAEYDFDGQSIRLPQPLDTEEQLLPFARRCFEYAWRHYQGNIRRYTQVGLTLWNLRPRGPAQISLFEGPERRDRDEAVQKSLDALRDRFGKNVIHRGAAVPAREEERRKEPLPMVFE